LVNINNLDLGNISIDRYYIYRFRLLVTTNKLVC
jgi:hypothetical protein